MNEVRKKEGELLGFLRVPVSQVVLQVPAGQDENGDERVVRVQTAQYILNVWRVTDNQLSALQANGLFQPLITRDMAISAARDAAEAAVLFQHGALAKQAPLMRYAEKAVDSMLKGTL